MGSIGVNNLAYPYLVNPTSGGGGIACGTGAAIVPVDASGAFTNNSKDIGTSSVRFKDLYLSGKIAASNSSSLQFGSTSCAIEGTSSGADYIKITTNSSEAMRIDSSGNLLVGKTSSNADTYGAELRSSGVPLVATSEGATTLNVNRRTSDGTIVNLQKDGSTVGSIASRGGSATSYITFPTSGSGAGIGGSTNMVIPVSETGVAKDAGVNLGSTSTRFKDLYLSGGVVFGATGGSVTSKTLDDYEEGTWTPTLVGATSGSCTVSANAVYTKVGRVVVVHGFLNVNTVGSASGNLVISNLPFSIADLVGSTSLEASGNVGYYAGFATGVNSICITAQTSFSGFSMRGLTSSTAGGMSDLNSTHVGTGDFRFSITYFTT